MSARLPTDSHDFKTCDCQHCKYKRRASGMMHEAPMRNSSGMAIGLNLDATPTANIAPLRGRQPTGLRPKR